MKYSNIIIFSTIILSGCSPLDHYLGFTPIVGEKPVNTQLQKTESHSSQNRSDSSEKPVSRSSAQATSNTSTNDTDTSTDNDPTDNETEVTSNSYTGGIPDGTAANETTVEIYLDDPEEPTQDVLLLD